MAKKALYFLSVLAWDALGLEPGGPGLRAAGPNEGNVVELGGLKSRAPAEWVEEKPDAAQTYKQYRLEAVRDDKDDARLTIEFAGKVAGEGADRQVERWKALFQPPEGKKLDDVARVRRLEVRGAAVTYLDVRGDYKGVPGNPATPREKYRLLAFISPRPGGLTGSPCSAPPTPWSFTAKATRTG